MKIEHIRIASGFIIAPLFGPISAAFLMALFDRNPSYHFDFQNFMSEIFGILYLFLLFGAPIAYLVTGLIGIPLFLLSRKYRLLNIWSISLGGAVAPLLPLSIMHLYNGYMYDDPSKSAVDLYLFISVCGLIVGVVFWFISGLRNNAYYNSSNAENMPSS